MSTHIHGIASCSAIDTAGEVVEIKGIDISSLTKTGLINWEHKSDTPAQIVGKILNAKKIFDQKDCKNEHELHFWNKVKLPFVYIVAELLDDYTDSAKECAGQMRYSQDNPDKQAILGFSVEGSEIPGTRVQKMLITRSIARKVTLTATPANKACVAEILDNQKPQIKDDFAEIFKSEAHAIEMFKTEKGVEIYEEFLTKKEVSLTKAQVPGSKYPPAAYVSNPKVSPPKTQFAPIPPTGKDPGAHIGTTTSGIKIHATKPVGDYGPLSSKEHQEAASIHREMSQKAPTTVARSAHNDKAKLHTQAANTANIKENRFKNAQSAKRKVAIEHVAKMNKSLEAGSTNAAPSTLVNGAAYQSENLRKEPANMGSEDHEFHGTKKKDWKKRAKQDYDNWSQKEQFEKFMKARMPHLHMGEIQAIGRTIALRKSINWEKSLNELSSLKKNQKSDKIDLVHYSSHPNLTEVDPKHKGTGVDSRTKGRETWHPHSFYYRASSQPESVVTGQSSHKYHTQIDPKTHPIYDIGSDPEKHVANSPSMEEAHGKIKESGYKGFHNSKHPDLSHVVAMYVPLKVKKEDNLHKSESESNPKLGSHFLLSAENPMHPKKNELKMNHIQTLAHLKNKGFKAHEVKGHYGSPETSIMIHDVPPAKAEELHGLASKLGQDSSIYSHEGKHEMRFHHGENAGKKIHGEGTVYHKDKPKDMYTTLPSGKHFTHNFGNK